MKMMTMMDMKECSKEGRMEVHRTSEMKVSIPLFKSVISLLIIIEVITQLVIELQLIILMEKVVSVLSEIPLQISKLRLRVIIVC